MTLHKLAYFSLIVIILAACKKQEPEPFEIDFGYGYYPLDTGMVWIYDVDSIIYDNFTDPVTIDTISFQIKEYVESIFEDNEGRDAYRIEVYKRMDEDNDWEIDNVFYANKTRETAEKIENNLRFIKLVFPVSLGKTWDGNSYIEAKDDLEYLDNWEYQITNVGGSFNVGSETFTNTVTILQEDELNVVEKRKGVEVYEHGVGMVYKELIKLDRPNQPLGDWERGFIINMSLNRTTQ